MTAVAWAFIGVSFIIITGAIIASLAKILGSDK